MFDRGEFLRLNNAYGPFTLDACADDGGSTAQVHSHYNSPSRCFLRANAADHSVWLFPPVDQAAAFVRHYLECKQQAPTSTSAVIVVPASLAPLMQQLGADLQLVKCYPAGTQLLWQLDAAGGARQVRPTPFALHVYYSAPEDVDAAVLADRVASHAGTTSAPSALGMFAQQPSPSSPDPEIFTLPAFPAAATQLIVYDGIIAGRPARVLIDGGASRDYVADRFVQRWGLPTTRSERLRVRSADGNIVYTSRAATVTLELGGFTDSVQCVVTQLAGYDVILGKPWLARHNPAINWTTNEVCVGAVVLTGVAPERLSPALAVLDARHTAKLLRPGHCVEVFVATLQQLDDSSAASSSSSSSSAVPTDMGPAFTAELNALLGRFADLMMEPTGLPPSRPHDHGIELTSGGPPPTYTGRCSPSELEELRRQLDDYMAKGWVRPSSSPFAAPILFVRKKSGELRMCVDYRGLNRITVRNAYPLPRIDELFDQLHGARVFTSLDLASGYHQVRVREADIWKTAFRTRYGLFEFTVMPFGLTNAPATFMALMNDVLRPYLDKFVVVYLDDILIYSKSAKDHLRHVELVLQALARADLRLKLKKCSFGRSSVTFLGHIVEAGTVRIDPGKVKAVLDWPAPRTVQEVQSFLGFTGWLREFVDHYAHKAAPLVALTRGRPAPNARVPWSAEQQAAFDALKAAITTAPCLVIADTSPGATFTVETDASGVGVAAVLSQDQGQGLRPVAYESRQLSPAEANYTARELELLAVVHAVSKWRCYLDSRARFSVITDHETLTSFFTQRPLTGRLGRWLEKLAPYAPIMDIQYRSGRLNRADPLSRRPDYTPPVPPTTSSAASAAPPAADATVAATVATSLSLDADWLTAVAAGYAADPLYSSARRPAFMQQRDGLWYVGSRLCVPAVEALRLRVLHESHDAEYRGHPGVTRTLAHAAARFWWPRMSRTVRKYVASCATCQRTKPSTLAPPGRLQPLPVPERPWCHVGMDLVTDLPVSSGFDAIAVFVDLFTKQAHFAPTTKTCTSPQLAQLFFDTVYRHHGLPDVIISDRDLRINASFFRSLFQRLGTKFNMSTSHHPQTDGQSERTIRTLQQIVRSYVHPLHDNWLELLTLAEVAYNSGVSASTGSSPFGALYGFEPRTPADAALPPTGDAEADSRLSRLQAVHTLVRANLEKAKAQQAAAANSSRRELSFAVGDRVRLDTEHMQLRDQPCSKFKDRFIGPFTIAAVISPVVYRLTLPSSLGRMHPVFHISRLLPWTDDTDHASRQQPDRPAPAVAQFVSDGYEVDRLLDVKIGPDPRYSGQALLFKVRWASPYDAPQHDSWEPLRGVAKLDALQFFLGTPAWAAFKATPQYAAFRRKHPKKLPKAPVWQP